MLTRPDAPPIAPGPHCAIPHPCPYHAHCTRGRVGSEHPVDALPRLGAKRRLGDSTPEHPRRVGGSVTPV